MKRILALLVIAVMMLSLVACVEEKNTTPTTTTTTTTTPAPVIENKLPELLAERNVPALKSREEMLSILESEVFG